MQPRESSKLSSKNEGNDMKIEMGVRIESNNHRLKDLIKKWANHHVNVHEKKKIHPKNVKAYIQKETKNDATLAVYHLDAFTKNWCLDCRETEKNDEPMFRCKKCEFSIDGGRRCAIKVFANNKHHNYPMDNFGAMS